MGVGSHVEYNPLPEAGDPGVDSWDALTEGYCPGGQARHPPSTILVAGHRPSTVTLTNTLITVLI